MKKVLLIVLGTLLMVSTIEAKNSKEQPTNIGYNYTYENAVNFEERGIQFFIFTNGEFDFNPHYNDPYYNENNSRREIGIRIDRDYRGRINRIGNSFVNYDNYGNVTRIGNVFMRYYRGKLTAVGHLKVKYDAWGHPTFYGNVKNNYYNYNGFSINLNVGDICNYNDAYFYRNDFRVNYSRIREDKNYYYYRANPNAKIGTRSKTLRRRKPTSVILNKKPTTITRRSNTTYRRPSTTNSGRTTTRTEKRTGNTSYRRPTSEHKERGTDRTLKQQTAAKNRSTSSRRN